MIMKLPAFRSTHRVMIVVSVPPTALSAAHGTETVIMSPLGFPRSPGCADVVTDRHQMRGRPGGTGTAGHVIRHQAIKIAESVSSPCSAGPKVHGDFTLSVIMARADRRLATGQCVGFIRSL